MEPINYRIGLDIGITSVGWAILLNNSNNEPIHILDMGVRIFDKAENPKNGASLAGERRMARSVRRRIRRKRLRLSTIKKLFADYGLVDLDEFEQHFHAKNLENVYELRCKGLDELLTGEELAQVLLFIAKHRGFRSTRKAEIKQDKDSGKMLAATKANAKLLEEKKYRTVGEMFYKDDAFKTARPYASIPYEYTTRNKQKNYQHTVTRVLLVDEVKQIFQAQRNLGSKYASIEFENKYLEIMQEQRSFDLGPGKQADGKPSPYAVNGFQDKTGKCTFEKDQIRAPRAAYTSEVFSLCEKLVHLKIVNAENGDDYFLSSEQRDKIFQYAHSHKEVTYENLRKLLGLSDNDRFKTLNYSPKKKEDYRLPISERVKKTEKAKFISLSNYYDIRKAIGSDAIVPDQDLADLVDRIAVILTSYKNDDSRTAELKKLNLNDHQISNLLYLSPAKYMHLSFIAMKKIIPFLKKGETYDKACEDAGYDFRNNNNGERIKLIKGKVLNDFLKDIPNPVAKRGISQAIKVLNAIILKYGSPQSVNIELARDMAKNFLDRQESQKYMENRASENEKIKKEIQELGKSNPTGLDIVKYRLWKDQQEYCLYTGERIKLEDLFQPGYDIDHIIPYSRSFDDSYHNKVLVTSHANREKGNRTPYEYMGNDPEKWNRFVTLVNSYVTDSSKKMNLFKHHFTPEDAAEFKERNLSDTRYITRAVYNLVRNNLQFSGCENTRAVNGAITSYLRKRWALGEKDRSTDIHHSVDAVIIACVTPGIIQKITRYTQGRELARTRGMKLVDEKTGEVFDPRDYTTQEWDEMFGVKPPLPWKTFKEEVELRLGTDPLYLLDTQHDFKKKLDYPDWMLDKKYIHPIFVSRMPRHKNTGTVHDATIGSPKMFADGYVIKKTDLTSLKLDKNGEIEGYYNPESDMLLYNALKARLIAFKDRKEGAKEAFKQPFYKPKADGTQGPLVKKVKICDKQTSGVKAAGGIANNGDMIRIDIFNVKGKYYMVPIYVSDTVKKELPNRAVVAHKPVSEWKVMDDKDFCFSLYPNDLIRISKKGGIKVIDVSKKRYAEREMLGYYTGADVSAGAIGLEKHDNSITARGIGIQSLTVFEKYTVDVLGNISLVRKEPRMKFGS